MSTRMRGVAGVPVWPSARAGAVLAGVRFIDPPWRWPVSALSKRKEQAHRLISRFAVAQQGYILGFSRGAGRRPRPAGGPPPPPPPPPAAGGGGGGGGCGGDG